MKKRSYQQYCPLAAGLDVIGERWTFLIVRELLISPKRYKDLLEGLVGIGTNLLSKRLKTLVKAGLVEQAVLPPPAASTVYQLTDRGRDLEETVLALNRWGLQFLGEKQPMTLSRPEWSLIAVKAAFRPEKAEDINLCCEWQIDDFIFYIHVHAGHLKIASGKATTPIAQVTTNGETLEALVFGKRSLKETITSPHFKITGSGLSVLRLLQTVFHEKSATFPETRGKASPKRSAKKKRVPTLSSRRV